MDEFFLRLFTLCWSGTVLVGYWSRVAAPKAVFAPVIPGLLLSITHGFGFDVAGVAGQIVFLALVGLAASATASHFLDRSKRSAWFFLALAAGLCVTASMETVGQAMSRRNWLALAVVLLVVYCGVVFATERIRERRQGD